MLQAWKEIEQLYHLPGIDPSSVQAFKDFKNGNHVYTRAEGNPLHYCAFFLPYDKSLGQIYLGHHKKADDWIPPGGHIERGEAPSEAAIREMQEELGVTIAPRMIEPFHLSVKLIGNPVRGCMSHYDVWHLIHIKKQDFVYDQGEYYEAGWFDIKEGVAKIAKNPDFAAIVAKLI